MVTINKRQFIGGSAALIAAPSAALGQDAPKVVEMSMGNPEAGVTVIEYASLTCPHCASFHARTWPELKANYVETGKINFIFREVYFDRVGLWAAALARCGGPERYFGIIDILFKKQSDWSRKEDPAQIVEALYAIGRQAGLDNDAMQACLQDREMLQAMVAVFKETTEADGVNSTPSFIINGEKAGNMSYEDFAKRLDGLLG